MFYRIVCILLFTVFLPPLPILAWDAVKIPDLRHKATVYRDVVGIPHIMAQNAHDLFLLQG